jgi:cysteine desulfurase
MSTKRAYLDYNASAPLLPAARAAMLAALDCAANPSSVHQDGRAARRLVDQARHDVAALVGAKADRVVFTSGATEAATTLLSPHWTIGRAPLLMSHLYVCASDHACFLSGGRFPRDQMTVLGVDGQGLLDLVALSAALAAHDHAAGLPLVAVHAANNETGVIQPVAEIAAIVKASGGILVIDAVQAAGRIAIDMSEGWGDCLILSAHKIGGSAGVGACVSASDLVMPRPLITGGGQERGHRAGTENLAGIAAFGAAARHALAALADIGRQRELRDRLEKDLLRIAPDATIFSSGAERLANTVFFAVPGLKAETAQIALDLAGFSVSSGSACSSGKVGPSHVLKALGVAGDEGALRVSIGAATTMEEIERLGEALATIVARRRARTKAA